MGLIVILLAAILVIVATVEYKAYELKQDIDNVKQKIEQPLDTLKDGVQDTLKDGYDKIKEETDKRLPWLKENKLPWEKNESNNSVL